MRVELMSRQVNSATIKWKFIWLMGIACFIALIILVAVFYRQTYARDITLNALDAKWTAFYEVPPRRGSIRARNGSILAISEKRFNVVLDPTMLGNVVTTSDLLSRKLGVDLTQLLTGVREARDQNRKYFVVKHGIDQAKMVEVHNLNLKGVFVEEYYTRYYPYKDQMSPHTIGFVRSRDGVHRQIEEAYDELLTGQPGRVYYQRDSRWSKIPGTTYVDREVTHGRDVYLTIDESIQTVCDIELDIAIDEYKADWGIVAVMDPNTGEILANAIRPTFDPNLVADGGKVDEIASNPLYGYVVEPGSIMKPIVVAGALERGDVNLSQQYYCPSSIKVKNITISEAKKGIGYGQLTLDKAIIKSSNVYMAQLGKDIGLNSLMAIFEQSMLFAKSGLGMPKEAVGRKPEHAIKDKHGLYPEIYDTDEATAVFGQGISVTPLAILTAYSEIANGGYPIQPRIVLGSAKDIGGVVGNVDRKSAGYVAYRNRDARRFSSERLGSDNRVYSDKTVEQMRSMLVAAVHSKDGTGKKARLSSGLTVAGKTGTGQVYSKYGGYAKGKYLSSFVGYFPADEPKYVVLVMFMNPRGKYYGGEVSAPLFRKVSDRICYLDRISPIEFLGKADSK